MTNVKDQDLLRMVWLCCGTDAKEVAAGDGVESDYNFNPAVTEFLELTRKVQLRLSKENAERASLAKEALFRIDLADTWIAQLRAALGKAMDALAGDPDHDVSLQAELELVRRAAVLNKKSVTP